MQLLHAYYLRVFFSFASLYLYVYMSVYTLATWLHNDTGAQELKKKSYEWKQMKKNNVCINETRTERKL